MTGVARSRSLLGPWEKRPGPFLEDSAAFRCPGHVGVAGAPGGGLLLAYRRLRSRGDPANRQFLIVLLHFDAEDWPAVGPAANRAAGATPAHFDFDGTRLGQGWQWPVGPRPSASSVHGELRLGRGVLGRQAGTGTFSCGHGGHRRAARFAARTRGYGVRRQRDRRGAARRACAGLARG